ncbi:restriction endonuclease subunit S [Enterococcus faecium]|nr:restriction endonuclease subunit S [Enterococcus faecium]
MSNNTQPEIRFPGFMEDWEQRKLGELAESFEYGLNASAKKFDGSNKYIRITDIDDISHKFNQSGVTSPDIDFASADNYKLKKGDILFARTGASVGKTYMYRESDGLVYYAGFLIRARIKSKISSEFVFQTTFTDSYNRFIKITSQRSGQPGVNAEEYSNFKIMIPNYEEQNAIGCFFKKIDDTITLHQRKLDLLKETKKGFLQKMFPKNGAKVPEIRFPGFTGDWEQRKLGDVLTVSKEKNKSNSYSKEQILSVSREVGTVNQIEYQGRSFAGADISGYKIVYPGQLIYTKSPLKGAPYGIFQLVTEEGIVSPLYAVYNSTEQALASFIGLQLKSDNIATHYLSPLVSKGAKNTINITDEGALDGRVTYPTITEQQKIVAFFKQLENTITLHQRKLDLLKETKKGFLQKMFV